MASTDQTAATLSTGFKFAGLVWPMVGAIITITVSILGSWYGSKLETQAQFAAVSAKIEDQALSDSKTFVTKDEYQAQVAEETTTLKGLMNAISEVQKDVSYMRGKFDQLVR